MKEELLKRLNKIVEEFADIVLKQYEEIPNLKKSLIHQERQFSDLIEEKKLEVETLKKERYEQYKEHEKTLDNLNKAKENYEDKKKKYDELLIEINKKEKEIEQTLEKTKLELLVAKDKTDNAEKIKTDIETLKVKYEAKLKSLEIDFNNLKRKEELLKEREIKLNTRENENYKKEAQLLEISKEADRKYLHGTLLAKEARMALDDASKIVKTVKQ